MSAHFMPSKIPCAFSWLAGKPWFGSCYLGQRAALRRWGVHAGPALFPSAWCRRPSSHATPGGRVAAVQSSRLAGPTVHTGPFPALRVGPQGWRPHPARSTFLWEEERAGPWLLINTGHFLLSVGLLSDWLSCRVHLGYAEANSSVMVMCVKTVKFLCYSCRMGSGGDRCLGRWD